MQLFRLCYTIDKNDTGRIYAEPNLLKRVNDDRESFFRALVDTQWTSVLRAGGHLVIDSGDFEGEIRQANLMTVSYEDLFRLAKHYGVDFRDDYVETLINGRQGADWARTKDF